MPRMSNMGVSTPGVIAWDGTTYFGHKINDYVQFHWSFEVTDTIAADAVFNIQMAPASDPDPCVPGAWVALPETPTCEGGAAGDQATITIPAGTPVGTVCSGTVPCRNGAFVRLQTGEGTVANVNVVLVRHGPKTP